jgi:hypothetical protein
MLNKSDDYQEDLNIKLDMEEDNVNAPNSQSTDNGSQGSSIDSSLSQKIENLMQLSNSRAIMDMLFSKLGISSSKQPYICFIHLLFKMLAITVYMFGAVLLNSASIFLMVSIVAVIDFWITKNITGRLLVGLRWWSVIGQDGAEEWKFETIDQHIEDNSIDKSIFWKTQILSCTFWALILVLKLLTFGFFYVISLGTAL